jgi:hypothetical protein
MVLLAACGGSGSSPTGTATDATITATAITAQQSGAVAIGTPPCDLVTSGEVAAATGLAVGEARDEPPISCLFPIGDDPGIAVYLNADDGAGRAIGPAAVFAAYQEMVADGSGESVAGLGRAAFYAPGFRTLVVDGDGGRFIAVGVNGGYGELDEPREALIAIAAAAVARL